MPDRGGGNTSSPSRGRARIEAPGTQARCPRTEQLNFAYWIARQKSPGGEAVGGADRKERWTPGPFAAVAIQTGLLPFLALHSCKPLTCVGGSPHIPLCRPCWGVGSACV